VGASLIDGRAEVGGDRGHRLAGVALALVIPTMVAAVALDPTRIGPDREHWPGNLVELAADPWPYPLALALMALGGVMALSTGVSLRAACVEGPQILGWGRLGLIAAGTAILGWTALKLRFYMLAVEWAASGEPVLGPLATSALETHGLAVTVAFLALPTLLVSVIAAGWGLQRRLAAPPWLRVFPIAAGIVVAISPVGFADIGPLQGFAAFLFVAAILLTVWTTLLGASLARGTR